MPNVSERGPASPRYRLLMVALATVLSACAAGGVSAAAVTAAEASASSAPREAGATQTPGSAAAPRQPIGSRPGRPTVHRVAGARIRLSSDRLLAGAGDQRLIVRARRDRSPVAFEAALIRRARADRRHASTRHPRTIAARAASSARGRAPLEPTAPPAGSYRLAVDLESRSGQARRLRVPVRVVPQSRRLESGQPGATAPAKLRAADRRPQALKLGSVNADLAFTPGSQASSAIATPDGDPDRVIAASGDADGAIEVLVSDAGMRSGSAIARDFPDSALSAGAGEAAIDPCCAPAVGAGPGGDLWAATTTDGADSSVLVARIPGAADAFAGPAVALPAAPGSDLQEKPAVAVGADRVAVAWVETIGPDQNVVLSECDRTLSASACDQPGGWSAPAPVTATSGLYSMPDLDLGPAGELVAVWWDAGGDNAIEASICAAGPPCGTADWSPEATIDQLDARGGQPLPLFCPIIAAPGGFVNPSPSVAIAPSGLVHISYSDLRANADPDSPSRCTASGGDATFDSYVASGASPGQLPLANTGVRLSNDDPGALNDHFLPALSVDQSDGTVEASFYSTASDPGGQFTDRLYRSSGDGGISFSSPAVISTDRSRFAGSNSDGIDYGDRQGSASAAGVFRAVWTDSRSIQGRDSDLYGLVDPTPLTIDSAPPGLGESPVVEVRFSSQAPRTECALDGGGWEQCTSPLTLGPLRNGDHRIRVRPTDPVGNPVTGSPEEATFTVLDTDPPETFITERPPARTQTARPRFAFDSDEAGAIFQCSYDNEDWRRCRESKSAKVSHGRHVFRVRAIDLGENIDPTPAVTRFRRDRACSKKRERRGRCERPA